MGRIQMLIELISHVTPEDMDKIHTEVSGFLKREIIAVDSTQTSKIWVVGGVPKEEYMNIYIDLTDKFSSFINQGFAITVNISYQED
jgi:hypothetical protein